MSIEQVLRTLREYTLEDIRMLTFEGPDVRILLRPDRQIMLVTQTTADVQKLFGALEHLKQLSAQAPSSEPAPQ